MLNKRQRILKRSFDFFLSILLLPLLFIPILFLWILAGLSTGRNGFFKQLRIGRYGRPFWLFKIRTLKGDAYTTIYEIKNDETSIGKWLRKHRLDELPQLLNVLLGDMSLVGPRPDIPGYADKLEGEDRQILDLRPGITGPATLKYKNEDVILLEQNDALHYNDTVIWPDKVKINKDYILNWSFWKDLRYLWLSVFG